MKTSSSGQKVSFITKCREAISLSRLWIKRRGTSFSEDLFHHIDENFEEYKSLYEIHSRRSIKSAAILEIGYGARPYRLASLRAKNLNAIGVDLDMPIIDGTINETFLLLRKNGIERALKSIIRHYISDKKEQKDFLKYYKIKAPFIEKSALHVGNASSGDFWNSIEAPDLIISEDVFEHIPYDNLKKILELMYCHISNYGIALIRPNIFTGITGGHLIEWYNDVVKENNKTSAPWQHLRCDRFEVNTYLNRLTRSDYRNLFSERFDIVDEIVKHPDLGREWYTGETIIALNEWEEEELFSNQVMFVLRKK